MDLIFRGFFCLRKLGDLRVIGANTVALRGYVAAGAISRRVESSE